MEDCIMRTMNDMAMNRILSAMSDLSAIVTAPEYPACRPYPKQGSAEWIEMVRRLAAGIVTDTTIRLEVDQEKVAKKPSMEEQLRGLGAKPKGIGAAGEMATALVQAGGAE